MESPSAHTTAVLCEVSPDLANVQPPSGGPVEEWIARPDGGFRPRNSRLTRLARHSSQSLALKIRSLCGPRAAVDCALLDAVTQSCLRELQSREDGGESALGDAAMLRAVTAWPSVNVVETCARSATEQSSLLLTSLPFVLSTGVSGQVVKACVRCWQGGRDGGQPAEMFAGTEAPAPPEAPGGLGGWLRRAAELVVPQEPPPCAVCSGRGYLVQPTVQPADARQSDGALLSAGESFYLQKHVRRTPPPPDGGRPATETVTTLTRGAWSVAPAETTANAAAADGRREPVLLREMWREVYWHGWEKDARRTFCIHSYPSSPVSAL